MVDESFIAAEAPPCDTPKAVAEKSSPQPPLPDRSDLQHEIAELKRAFADYMHKELPEIDRMRKELHETAQERDNHVAELKKLKQDQTLNSIANDYSFNDVEYLEYTAEYTGDNLPNTVYHGGQEIKEPIKKSAHPITAFINKFLRSGIARAFLGY